jgi:putative DNA primase/helicase
VDTSGNGLHVYFTVPEDVDAAPRGWLTTLAPGVDVKHNGYVVAAPSFSAEWQRPWRARCLAAPVPMPAGLVAALRRPEPRVRPAGVPVVLAAAPAVAARVAQLAAELHDAPEGAGNDEANRIAFMVGGYVGAGQLVHEDAFDALMEAIGDWGYRDVKGARGMLNTIDRALQDGAHQPRAWEALRSAFVPDVPELNAAPAEGGYGRTADDVAAELLALGGKPDELAVKVRAIALEILAAVSDAPGRQLWRVVLKDNGGLSFGDFAQLATWYAKEIKKAAKLAASMALMATEGVRELAEPDDPTAVVAQLLESIPRTGDVLHWSWWRGDFYRWAGTHHEVFPDAEVRQWLYRQTENAMYTTLDGLGMPTTTRWKPDKAKIEKLRDALAVNSLQRIGDADGDVIACSNAVLDIGGPVWTVHPHWPTRFNLYSQPYELDDQAQAPAWLAFLGQLFPGDVEAVALLQEWFGYVVSGRTDQQKILSLVGPPRSGKGTIARVLSAVLGEESVTSPVLAKLATNFGMEPLIGKRLAIFGDVRWSHRETQNAVPYLLGISGEDEQSVNRKNRTEWQGKLDVRFMMMSNDSPSFNDASGALASRLLHLEMSRSWLGEEDRGLLARLLGELPGILNWALLGLRRLLDVGRFTVPASSERLAAEVLAASSPIMGFVAEKCTLGADKATALDEAYEVWRVWCAGQGSAYVGNKQSFVRDLRSAYRGRVDTRRGRVDGNRFVTISGLCLAEPRPIFTETR